MKLRKPLTITSRTSSITNSFVQAVMPSLASSERDLAEAFRILQIDPQKRTCIYCGAGATDWDHLRPLVKNKGPTGYIDEVRNRVPSCAPCNQSKGGADWRAWMTGNAKHSPKNRGVRDIDRRIEILQQFERWGNLQKLDFRKLVGPKIWDRYWSDLEAIVSKMFDAQKEASKVRIRLKEAIDALTRERVNEAANESSISEC